MEWRISVKIEKGTLTRQRAAEMLGITTKSLEKMNFSYEQKNNPYYTTKYMYMYKVSALKRALKNPSKKLLKFKKSAKNYGVIPELTDSVNYTLVYGDKKNAVDEVLQSLKTLDLYAIGKKTLYKDDVYIIKNKVISSLMKEIPCKTEEICNTYTQHTCETCNGKGFVVVDDMKEKCSTCWGDPNYSVFKKVSFVLATFNSSKNEEYTFYTPLKKWVEVKPKNFNNPKIIQGKIIKKRKSLCLEKFQRHMNFLNWFIS